MKYIILSNGEDHLPVIFPSSLTHRRMAQAVVGAAIWDRMDGLTPVSAGFFDVESSKCYGEPETLGIKSRGAVDEELITQAA